MHYHIIRQKFLGVFLDLHISKPDKTMLFTEHRTFTLITIEFPDALLGFGAFRLEDRRVGIEKLEFALATSPTDPALLLQKGSVNINYKYISVLQYSILPERVKQSLEPHLSNSCKSFPISRYTVMSRTPYYSEISYSSPFSLSHCTHFLINFDLIAVFWKMF